MRFIDFMVFYVMANFKKKQNDGSIWGSQLARAVFLASLPLSFAIVSLAEIICFFIFRVNIFDDSHFKIILIIGGILNATLLDYVYINKKRYEYITAPEYKPFTLSITLGVTICFLLGFLSVVGSIGLALVINALLTK